MQDLQEVFNRLRENKEKLKDLRSMCKGVHDSSQQFQEVNDELKTLREKRKSIKSALDAQCEQELIQMDDLKIDIESDEQLLSDIAITQYAKGENIELTDQYDNTYEPVFQVKFKKSS